MFLPGIASGDFPAKNHQLQCYSPPPPKQIKLTFNFCKATKAFKEVSEDPASDADADAVGKIRVLQVIIGRSRKKEEQIS
jgi:hypothetical protein